MLVVFAAVGVVLLACLLTWAVVISLKIWERDDPVALRRESVLVRREAAQAGLVIPVGAREIREDQQYGEESHALLMYEYGPFGSSGIPNSWHDDLWIRRN
ncbi:MAG: hypothetical protein R3178_00370 [Rhodothermales bacterium]|nr:hypothetical protein [Rhodothermales bacterium]